ncbi:Metallo-dependent phosphatase [Teratosphaeria nubilosa]|uniref:Metallo-dependent phosphatase n=1 Tax=Teratosphaeria nubilosa TaxID=161662 RepID=A0A6G1L0C0_9PEZI|nr:Metallo-dependent phosphatase [Teratosphaeria nubilosa]
MSIFDFLITDSPYDAPPLLHTLLTQPIKLLIRLLDIAISLLRTPPPQHPHPIRLVCLSDTHNLTLPASSIPQGDILIHAGDLTNDGTPAEIQNHIHWLDSLPHEHKVVIAGNHDYFLDPRSRAYLPLHARDGTVDWKGLQYLENSGVTVSVRGRDVRVYGAPQTACGVEYFAFQHAEGRDAWTGVVEEATDVLVTHGPPKNLLDLPRAMGDEFLLREVGRVKPAVHVFGHVHAGRTDLVGWLRGGKAVVKWDAGREVVERGLGRGDGGLRLLDPRCWVDVVGVVWGGVLGVVWERLWGGRTEETTFVNASLMLGNTGRLGNRVQVVDI